MPEKSHKNNPKNFAAQKHENVANNDRAGAGGERVDRGRLRVRVCECECGDVDHKKENVKVLLRSARFFKCSR